MFHGLQHLRQSVKNLSSWQAIAAEGIVMDGLILGPSFFHAELKIFLVASVEERR